MHKIKVKGVEKMLTFDEVIARAQKAENAEIETQNAVEKQRAAEAAIRFREDALNAHKGDESAFRRFGKEVGMPDDHIETLITHRRSQQIKAQLGSGGETEVNEEEDEGTEGGGEVSVDAIAERVAAMLLPVIDKKLSGVKVGINNLDPRLGTAITEVVGNSLDSTLKAAVASDKHLGKILKYGSDSQRKAVVKRVMSEATRRAKAGDKLTDPEVIGSLLQDVRTELDELGIRPENAPTPFTGLGSSPSGSSSLYQSEEPPVRPKEGQESPDWFDYVTKSIMYAAAHGDSEQG